MPSKQKVRGGIVGSGFAANLHYEGIERVHATDVDLVGIFSPTPGGESWEKLRREFGEIRTMLWRPAA